MTVREEMVMRYAVLVRLNLGELNQLLELAHGRPRNAHQRSALGKIRKARDRRLKALERARQRNRTWF
jgi:hypothetical protein